MIDSYCLLKNRGTVRTEKFVNKRSILWRDCSYEYNKLYNNVYYTLNELNEVRARMNDEQRRTNEENSTVGASNWLTNLPIKELEYELNKDQFQDALCIRYGWSRPRLPTECVCGSRFDIPYALSCKKGGFVTLRHNEIS